MEVIEAWAIGYARSRGYPVPVAIPGGLWMEVGLPGQRGRIVLRRYEASVVSDLMERIDGAGVYLELPVDRDEAGALIGSHWLIRDRAYLMTSDVIADPAPACVPEGYSVKISEEGGLLRAEIGRGETEAAASGYCAVSGPTCIFDRIVTHEHHRRRGLGTLVMSRLVAAAYGLGARSGVLIATAEGRSLYGTLGWSEASPITSAISP